MPYKRASRSSILEKLEVHSRTEALAAVFGLGIVKPAN
jgi:DNA-binding NarL/FixJ family response regulator